MSRDKVIAKMKEIFREVPYGIDHTLNVLQDAALIMEGEGIEAAERELISVVAILHDIGAVEAQRKYGSMEAMYQEKEGPPIARRILEELHYDSRFIERVCFIISFHHTPAKIDGLDFQIQWEADLLANLAYMDIRNDKEQLRQYIEEQFKTATGKALALERFMQK
ncbi:HD domain-containing protein [Propionispora vibrioides]|uniref:HD domain-containing protein n=1 Tax=Propionispora vibrioides TaxID=112903 RepID=A0A1H8XX04_9FIRM|nr:HD domain-containing protein [Propionispora vibrioides]SEP44301.1 HD domain-containing protein [Propionispora vibrioides]